jgi:Papain family cysteine protease
VFFYSFFLPKWGTGWGENGYVRIHREKGTKGEPGQCGIACSPSVALGGTLLKQTNGNFKGSDIYNVNQLRSSGINNPTEATNDPSHPLEIVIPYTALEKFCIRLGHQLDNNSRCGRFADFVSMHRAMVLGATGLLATLLVVVWPLTLDCRRRAHRLRMRKLQQQLERENDVLREIQHDETSTLMSQNGIADITTYGTSTDRAAH